MRRASFVDKARIEAFFDTCPVDSVLARVAMADIGLGGSRAHIGVDESRNVTSFVWDYGNVVPLGMTSEQLDWIAHELTSRWRSASSLVGPQDQVLGLWERVEGAWGPARQVRDTQHSMVMGEELLVTPDARVRAAQMEDFPIVFPSSVAMYKEEVGYDPTVHGSGYERRARSLVANGHTFIVTGDALDGPGERVIFKADIGALGGGVAQIQGVWVAPDLRGKGLGTGAMAMVTELVRASIAPTVSLYVNDYNERALAMYRSIGYVVDNTWATVLI